MIYYFTLWPWPLIFDLEHLTYRLWCDETLYRIWTQSSNPRRRYCDFNVDLMTLNIALRVALVTVISFIKFYLRQLIRSSIIAFLMLTRYVTLWPWPLTCWPWISGITSGVLRLDSVKNLSEIDKLVTIYHVFACTDKRLLGVCTKIHQTFRGHRAIIPTQEFCFSIPIPCCIFERERLKVEWCFKRR